jgi:uncharacterized paraquat-inducible protein A
MKKNLALALFLLSLVFLLPGLTLPVMTIKATIDKQVMMDLTTQSILDPEKTGIFVHNMLLSLKQMFQVEGTVEVFEKTRSILETMNNLIANGHVVVGILIGVFAVIIPSVKILLILLALLQSEAAFKNRLFSISSLLSKWSMSDVFVMAIIVTFMAINANEDAIEAVQMQAQLQSGFYFFATYCVLAIAAGQLMEAERNIEKVESHF